MGMEILDASDISLATVMEHYFSVSPPFEASGDKKKEFPDAVALLSLDIWAKKQGLRLLAVSRDRGWSAYANATHHIDVQKDLVAALSMFQEQHTQVEAFVALLIDAANNVRATSLIEKLQEAVAESLSELDVAAEFTSSEDVSYESVKLEVEAIKLTGHDGELEISIVRTGANRIAFTVLATVNISASTTFTFSDWEGEQGSLSADGDSSGA